MLQNLVRDDRRRQRPAEKQQKHRRLEGPALRLLYAEIFHFDLHPTPARLDCGDLLTTFLFITIIRLFALLDCFLNSQQHDKLALEVPETM